MPRTLKPEPISSSLRSSRKKYAEMLAKLDSCFEFEVSGMNTMAKRVLLNYEITSIEKLCALDDAQLKTFRQCGKTCFSMITKKRDQYATNARREI